MFLEIVSSSSFCTQAHLIFAKSMNSSREKVIVIDPQLENEFCDAVIIQSRIMLSQTQNNVSPNIVSKLETGSRMRFISNLEYIMRSDIRPENRAKLSDAINIVVDSIKNINRVAVFKMGLGFLQLDM